MAKVSRFAITKISATINADYKENNVQDAFFLDGRSAKKREQYGADITNNGEDRGFFYAVFANSQMEAGERAEATASILNQMRESVKLSNDKIDNEINDLADCAVEVGGRATIAREGVRQSYFAGIILKEAEIAAVTRGGGCAFLYRNNALYPLTTCDYELVNADYHGNTVEHMMDFSAGVAGTIRYSNIAQVQQNDILVLCNKEVLEAVGQRNLISLLYRNQDCAEAAAEIIDLARETDDLNSLQIILANIQEVIPPERTSRLNLGFFQNQNEGFGQETTRYEPLKGGSDSAIDPNTVVNQSNDNKPEEPFYPSYGDQKSSEFLSQKQTIDDYSENSPLNKEEEAASPDDTLEPHRLDDLSQGKDDQFKPDYPAVHETGTADQHKADEPDHREAAYSDLEDKPVSRVAHATSGNGNQTEDPDDVPIFEPIVPDTSKTENDAFAAGQQYVDPDYQDYDTEYQDDYHSGEYDTADWQDDREKKAHYAPEGYPENYYDDEGDEDEFYIEEENKSSKARRTVLYVVLILICLACLYALARMILPGNKQTAGTETSQPSDQTEPGIIQTTDEANIRTPIQSATESDPAETAEPGSSESGTDEPGTTGELTGTAYVTVEGLRMREQPNTDSAVVAEFAEGEMVEIIEAAEDNWYLVRSTDGNGFEGYMLGDYLRD